MLALSKTCEFGYVSGSLVKPFALMDRTPLDQVEVSKKMKRRHNSREYGLRSRAEIATSRNNGGLAFSTTHAPLMPKLTTACCEF